MRDASELRRRIEVLIGVATIAVGCTRGESTPTEVQPEPKPTTKATVETEKEKPKPSSEPTTAPTPTAPPDLPTGIGHPTGGGCGPIAWCGTLAEAKSVEKKGATTKLGCPSDLESNPSWKGPWFAWGNLDEAATKGARADGGAGACCYALTRLCGGGRPLVDGDVARVAAVREGRGWHAPIELASDARRIAVGEGWLRDARMEHASVASFARLSMDLLALGAPPDLIADCHRAALDEIRHAQACFAIASRHLGHDVEPGTLTLPAPRAISIETLARDTVIEGCFGESAAALIATRAAAACEDPATRAALEGIARDETAHAALAFRIVRWCIAVGGERVRDAVRTVRAPIVRSEAVEGLESFGLLGARAIDSAIAEAHAWVVAPLLAEIEPRATHAS